MILLVDYTCNYKTPRFYTSWVEDMNQDKPCAGWHVVLGTCIFIKENGRRTTLRFDGWRKEEFKENDTETERKYTCKPHLFFV